MKTKAFYFILAGGAVCTGLLLALSILVEDPLEQQFRETLTEVCKQNEGFHSEAEVLAAFPELQLAKKKLEHCRALKSQLCRLTHGPAGGPGEDLRHCQEAYLKVRQEIARLLASFASKHFFHEP